jgi:ppGpp synthetase/RelA/SpoT-type nucleotidyltranferase
MDNSEEFQLNKEFNDLKPYLEEWGNYVVGVLNRYIQQLHLSGPRVQIRPNLRIKDNKSLIQKAFYRNKRYKNPIKEIEDKVGVRVVFLCLEDVEKLDVSIKSSSDWKLKEQSQDFEKDKNVTPETFKYQSNHYILCPTKPYIGVEDLSLLTCEVQIRTLAQHIYAEVSHDTVYKSSTPIIDAKIYRLLASTMAFLESTDEKILQIYDRTNPTNSSNNDRELLERLYRRFVPDYVRSYVGERIITDVFNCLGDENLKTAMASIEQYVSENEDKIRKVLDNTTTGFVLYGQEVILLLMYSLTYNQTYIIKNWPFSSESLEDLTRRMNFSTDILDV